MKEILDWFIMMCAIMIAVVASSGTHTGDPNRDALDRYQFLNNGEI